MTLRVCRVVTAATSAERLLAKQLRVMPEVEWTVIAGDIPPALDDVTTVVVPMGRELEAGDVRAFLRLVSHFHRHRYAVVQTHTPKASMLGLPAARLTGHRAIYTIHGALYFRGNDRLANVLGWLFERWCTTWAHEVLVQSREDLDALPRAKIVPRRKVRYLGNGIDMAHFATVPPADGPPTVLMIGRLVVEKGCQDFFELARRLRGTARCVLVGPTDADQRDAIDQAELEAAIEDGLVYVGDQPDVRPWLAASSVVVLPSYREGIPRALLEASATGRAVVAYDVRGVREVVPPGLGLLVPRGDVAGMERVVTDLLGNERRRHDAAAACASFVRVRFDEHLVVERLRTVYATPRQRRRARRAAR